MKDIETISVIAPRKLAIESNESSTNPVEPPNKSAL